LNAILNDACLERVRPEYGSKILDVGSGLGQFTRMLARSAEGSALGVEQSEEQLNLAVELAREDKDEERTAFRLGDATNLPLKPDERGTFDIAHARFILEHVSESLRVVHQMVGAVKTGGRIILMDDDHDLLRFYPEPPQVMNIWAAYIESYRKLSNDPFIGRKLPELIHKAGALPVRADLVFFGACKGQETFDPLCDNWEGLMNGALATMLEHDVISKESFENGMQEFRAWRETPYANMVFGSPWCEGVRL